MQPTAIVEVSTAAPIQPVATAVPTEVPTVEPTLETAEIMAFINPNGNIVIRNLLTGDELPLTSDATGEMVAEGESILRYQNLAWSSDGQLLGFERQEGRPVKQGLEFVSSLQVYHPQTGEFKALLEGVSLAGYSWRPGTHQVAYALGVEQDYWFTADKAGSNLAKGIFTVDADSSANVELVKPERGLHLVRPQWSPDGSLLGFEEVEFMEGRGKFAYFDTTTGKYSTLDQQVGNYDWLLDGKRIVLDTLSYTSTLTERIWIANRDGSGAQRISPDYAEGYAFSPTISPFGELVAYLAQLGPFDGGEMQPIRIFIQPLEEVEPRELAEFGTVYSLDWAPDGASLLITVGTYEAREIVQINLNDGSLTEIIAGSSPAMQP